MDLKERFEDGCVNEYATIDAEYWLRVYMDRYPSVYAEVGTSDAGIRVFLQTYDVDVDVEIVLIKNMRSFNLNRDYALVKHDIVMAWLLRSPDRS